MRFTIRDLLWLTVVVALGVGWWADRRLSSQLPSHLLKQRIASATQVKCTISGIDRFGKREVVIGEPLDVEQFVRQATKVRRWQPLPGPLSESRMIGLEFLGENGDTLAKCVILGRAFVYQETNDSYWLSDWPEGLVWAMQMTKDQDTARRR